MDAARGINRFQYDSSRSSRALRGYRNHCVSHASGNLGLRKTNA